mmetsp:Transcript_28254/g.60175  ORF Transcript_28254/g.60175 Transcript_28254/m.60175 type:complete len:81 (+) Transcript_28254:41-283(+)
MLQEAHEQRKVSQDRPILLQTGRYVTSVWLATLSQWSTQCCLGYLPERLARGVFADPGWTERFSAAVPRQQPARRASVVR